MKKSAMNANVADKIETACHSDIGGRDEQQDRVAVFAGEGAQLLVVADGLGGHAGGALAAQAVIDVAHERFEASVEVNPADLLTAIVRDAHERIRLVGAGLRPSPHSTCVLLHVSLTEAVWIHVGDSRLYRFTKGKLAERTLDHSVVELMRLQGRIDEEEMRHHPDRNRLFEALGGDRPPEAEMGEHTVSKEDGYLLASDGFWENVLDGELESVVGARNLAKALKDMVERATVRGGADCDNVAVAVARHRSSR